MGFLNGKAALPLALCIAFATAVAAMEAPVQTFSWAFPNPPPATPGKTAPDQKAPAPRQDLTVPGSNVHYDDAQMGDLFQAVDWFPNSHPAAPRSVLNGRKPDAMACGFCHLPNGQGRPENAPLAGMPVSYIAGQVREMRSGTRSGGDPSWRPTKLMTRVAMGATEDQVAEAAAYFSKLKYEKAFRLVEARDIPAVDPAFGVYRRRSGGAHEPLGARIIEVPNDFDRFELRDNRPGYTTYIPVGAIGRGRMLAENGGDGRFPACASCHGVGLKGGLGPPPCRPLPGLSFPPTSKLLSRWSHRIERRCDDAHRRADDDRGDD